MIIPGEGPDGKPRLVKDVMRHPAWQNPPYDSARMPPPTKEGVFPCVLLYYGLACSRCDKQTCMFKDQKRESNPGKLQETRENDPHWAEFEQARKDHGGDDQGSEQFVTPASGARAGPSLRSRTARSARLR